MDNEYFKKIAITIILAVLIVLSFILVRPILLSIIFGIILAFIFTPIYDRVAKILKSKNISAFLMCILLLAVIFIPLWYLTPVMVNQSIKQYLLTNTKVPENKIDSLLDYSQGAEDADLTDNQVDAVIDALDKVKVLDPACGSGAFPIGILQKILLILQKVDPDSKKWKTSKNLV